MLAVSQRLDSSSRRNGQSSAMARRAAAVVVALMIVATSCGGSDTELGASCHVEPSELGPFGPETTLGSTMDEATARARNAESGFDRWLEIHAEGNWDVAWRQATDELGGVLHDDLSWIDVAGTIDDLYRDGESHGFVDLRVSRSFQGKLEDTDEPLFIGVASDTIVNAAAGCRVTSVVVGDQMNAALFDVRW